ncbi:MULTISPECIES: hypothetical protein [unclassified Mycobacterium]|uniref:hypothetical protein n=1 Tax=unclassified Mycobacterium TaxID=2642494 RepID=UPI0029C667CB|nr:MULTISPECIES: hypothetical protein [unclassified Mycobacterium]
MRENIDSFFAELPRPEDLRGETEERLRAFYGAAADVIATRSTYFRLEAVLYQETPAGSDLIETFEQSERYLLGQIANVIQVIATDAGVPRPGPFAVEMAELTISLTRGSVRPLGRADDAERVKITMRRLAHLIGLCIDDAVAHGTFPMSQLVERS